MTQPEGQTRESQPQTSTLNKLLSSPADIRRCIEILALGAVLTGGLVFAELKLHERTEERQQKIQAIYTQILDINRQITEVEADMKENLKRIRQISIQ